MGWRWLEGDAFDAAFHGFTDDEARENEMDRREAEINKIAGRLDDIRTSNERAGFELQARYDNDYDRDDYDPYEDMEDDERAAAEAEEALRRRIELAKEQAVIDTLEERLAELGARMARPYEHWNEEEKLMEYMERDR